MRLYRWSARNKRGKKFCGELRAGDEKEVAEFIRENYGYVTGIELVKHWRDVSDRFVSDKVYDKDRESFFRQLATLLNGGVPLLKGLELMKSKSSGHLAKVCKALIANLKNGKSLAASMREQNKVFGCTSVEIVEAGEKSGSLSVLLGELADYYKSQNELKHFLKNACIYPCIVICLTICTTTFFAWKVLPLFLELYASLEVEQTTILKVLTFLTEKLECYRWETTGFFLFFLGEIYYQRGRIKEGCLELPVLSDCYHKMMEIRYCRVLAIMLKSGIAMPIALTAAAETLQSPDMEEKSKIVSCAVTRGVCISQAAALNGELFSETSLEFISVGEDSGSLPEMLLEAANIVDTELQAKLKSLKTMIEPVLLLIISAVVGCVIFSVASPMLGLISNMPEYQ